MDLKENGKGRVERKSRSVEPGKSIGQRARFLEDGHSGIPVCDNRSTVSKFYSPTTFCHVETFLLLLFLVFARIELSPRKPSWHCPKFDSSQI
ncbi:hypothetical protein V6N13_017175 [Hibiscus sabdariffa]|uniref:Uncharacterized protein n=1 Tax=Hibiscus sabdariffa TaxID=183260 RepID=A0ABR2CZ55_9ROSI